MDVRWLDLLVPMTAYVVTALYAAVYTVQRKSVSEKGMALCFAVCAFLCAGQLVSLLCRGEPGFLAYTGLSLLAAAAVYGVTVGIYVACRTVSMGRTPAMKQAMAYMRSHRVEAVLCDEQGLRFYRRLVNSEYCRSEMRYISPQDALRDNRPWYQQTFQEAKPDFSVPAQGAYRVTVCFQGQVRYLAESWEMGLFVRLLNLRAHGYMTARHILKTRVSTARDDYAVYASPKKMSVTPDAPARELLLSREYVLYDPKARIRSRSKKPNAVN